MVKEIGGVISDFQCAHLRVWAFSSGGGLF
jgi:hypothetical protein